MFYKTRLQDHIRVPPALFDEKTELAVIKMIKNKYGGFIDKDLGIVVDVLGVETIGDGIIIPGDGASYYDTTFDLIVFKPEMKEVLPAKVTDIADFGAFLSLGPAEGMVHISQTMDDFVSFSKDKVLLGKDSKRSLKVSDQCRARIIAVSFKEIGNPKIGLTMRQQGLGKLEWLDEKQGKPEKSEKSGKPEKKKK